MSVWSGLVGFALSVKIWSIDVKTVKNIFVERRSCMRRWRSSSLWGWVFEDSNIVLLLPSNWHRWWTRCHRGWVFGDLNIVLLLPAHWRLWCSRQRGRVFGGRGALHLWVVRVSFRWSVWFWRKVIFYKINLEFEPPCSKNKDLDRRFLSAKPTKIKVSNSLKMLVISTYQIFNICRNH